MKNALQQRRKRHKKIRARVRGTRTQPRLAVFRSNNYLYAQLIDDNNGETLAHADSRSVQGTNEQEKAKAVGAAIAQEAKKQKITNVVFDRGGFLYKGKVRLVAEGARDAGLVF